MKKKTIITSVLILLTTLIFISSIIYLYNNEEKIKLKSIGYGNLESREILKLTKSEIDKILKYDYNKNLIYIIESDNYDPNKLDLYLKYINEYKDIDYLKIFSLINNENMNIEKIDEYINLLKQYNNISGIINYINDYKDLDIKLTDTTLDFMAEKYFISDYTERYLLYYEKNKSLSYEEIITRINSNLDYKFYDDSKEADLSKEMYTLVNKYYYLPYDYIPNELETVSYEYSINNTKLNKTSLENFINMFNAAKENGLTIKITTAYRDYNFQSILYNNYVNSDGQDKADTYSARPGHSEHQFGYSIDLTNGENAKFSEFESTKEYEWLKDNAYKYGFILRYPKDKEYITGYQFEPWHYRYVGTEISNYIQENNITYEEYYAYYLR